MVHTFLIVLKNVIGPKGRRPKKKKIGSEVQCGQGKEKVSGDRQQALSSAQRKQVGEQQGDKGLATS